MSEQAQHWQDFYAKPENFARVFLDKDALVMKSRSYPLDQDDLTRLSVISEKIDRMLD